MINFPPRYGKSLLVSVLWPVWEWIRHPATRWVFTSYAESLAGQHSQDRRTLLQSPWYCRHWGVSGVVNASHRGERVLERPARPDAGHLGWGPPSPARGATGSWWMTPTRRWAPRVTRSDNRVIEYFRRSVATRLDDKQRGAIVVVMQRLHAQRT